MNLDGTSIANVNASPKTEPDRPFYHYDLPEKMAKQFKVKSLGLVELTADEELMATKRVGTGQGSQIKLAYELAKESLRLVDGKPVTTVDGSADFIWNRLPAPVRSLILAAYGEIHNPKEEDVSSFLKSRQVKVG